MKVKEVGWICKHPEYGSWFISRSAVIADWKQDHKAAYGEDAEPNKVDIESWFNDQTSWIEISKFGTQIERPDMEAFEEEWLRQMKRNPNWIEDVTEVKGD